MSLPIGPWNWLCSRPGLALGRRRAFRGLVREWGRISVTTQFPGGRVLKEIPRKSWGISPRISRPQRDLPNNQQHHLMSVFGVLDIA